MAAPRISFRDSVSLPSVRPRLPDAIADPGFVVPVIVFQFGDFNCRFALAADVDEGDLRADREMSPRLSGPSRCASS